MIAEGPESRWRESVYEQKVPSEEEKEAPPPGSKLALWRLGACGLSLYSRHRQGPATRQREEGLRAFNLLVGGVKPPDLGGSTLLESACSGPCGGSARLLSFVCPVLVVNRQIS